MERDFSQLCGNEVRWSCRRCRVQSTLATRALTHAFADVSRVLVRYGRRESGTLFVRWCHGSDDDGDGSSDRRGHGPPHAVDASMGWPPWSVDVGDMADDVCRGDRSLCCGDRSRACTTALAYALMAGPVRGRVGWGLLGEARTRRCRRCARRLVTRQSGRHRRCRGWERWRPGGQVRIGTGDCRKVRRPRDASACDTRSLPQVRRSWLWSGLVREHDRHPARHTLLQIVLGDLNP